MRLHAGCHGCRYRARQSRGPSLMDVQVAAFEIDVVDRRDLQLAARRGLDRRGDVDDVIVVEIKAGDGPVGLRLLRLFLDRSAPGRCAVEADDAIALRIVDMIGEYGRAARCWPQPAGRCATALRRRRCCRRGSSPRCPSPMNSRPMMKASASPFGLRPARHRTVDAELASRRRAVRGKPAGRAASR